MAEFSFDVKCESCGKSVDAEFDRYNTLIVTPCETCREAEYERGKEEVEQNLHESITQAEEN